MSLPRLLLVDDSQAILAYETACLSAHYAISVARNGVEALEQARDVRPAAVLLDLSMPGLNGDEVLAQMKSDPELREIPVIIVSTEGARAEACLASGAAAFLPKPIRADELRALVGRVLDDAKRHLGSFGVLVVGIGELELGIPLERVRRVVLQPATRPVLIDGRSRGAFLDLHGESVFVLDMAQLLGVEHGVPLVDRWLVPLESEGLGLALGVDTVREPEVFRSADVTWTGPAHADDSLLGAAQMASVAMGGSLVRVIDPRLLFSPDLLAALPEGLRHARASMASASGCAPPE